MFMPREGNDVRTLSQEDINRLPRGTFTELRQRNLILQECTQCNITLEEFQQQTRVIALPCKHAFKEEAIIQWLTNNSNRCPVCRMVVGDRF